VHKFGKKRLDKPAWGDIKKLAGLFYLDFVVLIMGGCGCSFRQTSSFFSPLLPGRGRFGISQKKRYFYGLSFGDESARVGVLGS
jgi:hypothetical protein